MILTHIAAFLGGALLAFGFSFVYFSSKLKKVTGKGITVPSKPKDKEKTTDGPAK